MTPQEIAAFDWPQVTAVLGGISMFLTFIGAWIFKHYESKNPQSAVRGEYDVTQDALNQERMSNMKEKIKTLEEIVRALAKDYSDIKTEISSLKTEADDLNNKTYRDIEKLEDKIDRLINMMIKLLSEDKE